MHKYTNSQKKTSLATSFFKKILKKQSLQSQIGCGFRAITASPPAHLT